MNCIFNKNIALLYEGYPEATAATCTASRNPLILYGSITSNLIEVGCVITVVLVGSMIVSISKFSINISNLPGLSLLNCATNSLRALSFLFAGGSFDTVEVGFEVTLPCELVDVTLGLALGIAVTFVEIPAVPFPPDLIITRS